MIFTLLKYDLSKFKTLIEFYITIGFKIKSNLRRRREKEYG
jgi:hypothetical protein